MRHLPLEYYGQWPFARKAVIFLRAAKKPNKPVNLDMGSWEVSYYLLSHAVELSIKAVAQLETDKIPVHGHDKVELANRYQAECQFTPEELATISALKDLNNGPGGLRYENEPQGEFLPSTFNNGVKIIERLLEKFESLPGPRR